MNDADLKKAVSDQDEAQVHALLAAGKKPLLETNRRSLLHLAAMKGGVAILTLLLDAGIPIENQTPKGYTALHVAAGHDRIEVIEALLSRGAAVEALENTGKTPYLVASESNSVDAARVLLALGANPYTLDAEGKSALQIAKAGKHAEFQAFQRSVMETNRWGGTTPTLTPEAYVLAGGHGRETLGPRTFTIPPDTNLITFAICGNPTYDNELYDQFLDMFVPEEDSNNDTIAERKAVYLDPPSLLPEMESHLGLPKGTLHLHPAETPCPNLYYTPLALIRRPLAQLLSKSGVYKYPLKIGDFLDEDGAHRVFTAPPDAPIPPPLLSMIYKDSVFPTVDVAQRIFAQVDGNLTKFEFATEAHIHEIMTHLGPGTYYYFACRSITTTFPFQTELRQRAAVNTTFSRNNIVEAANKYKNIIPLVPQNIHILDKVRLIRQASEKFQKIARHNLEAGAAGAEGGAGTGKSRRVNRRGGRRTRRRGVKRGRRTSHRLQRGGTALEVLYGNTVGGNVGNPTSLNVSPTLEAPPTVTLMNSEPSTLYTLMMVDPDAVSPTGKITYLHWLIVNKTRENDGVVTMPYRKPTPPAGSGTHHYKFLLYKQPAPLATEAMNQSQRAPFNVDTFVSANGLTLLQTVEFSMEAPLTV